MPRTENERLKTFVEVIRRQHRLSIAQLAKELDRSRDTLVGWLDHTRIPADAIGFLNSSYGLQLEWFYHGRGPMILDTSGTPRDEQGEIVRSSEPRPPYGEADSSGAPPSPRGYPVPVMAVVGNADAHREDRPPALETGRLISLFRPPIPGEVAVEIAGDSMEPLFFHGDIITCRPVPVDDLRDGDDYVVLTERGPLLRRIVKQPDSNLLLKTRNPVHPDDYRPTRVFSCYEIVTHVHPYRRPGESSPANDTEEERHRPSAREE